MTSPWDTTGPSIFTKGKKTKSEVSAEVQAKLVVKPRGREAPISGRGKLDSLNSNVPAHLQRGRTRAERGAKASAKRIPPSTLPED